MMNGIERHLMNASDGLNDLARFEFKHGTVMPILKSCATEELDYANRDRQVVPARVWCRSPRD